MKDPIFITGNQNKADFLAKWLGVDIAHQKVELDELQSLDSHVIAEHKARQAYGVVQSPVLIEDVSLVFHAFGKLPGPFIKWFIEEMSLQQICDLLASSDDRSATASVCYCLFDGHELKFFDGSVIGAIAPAPRGERGFGFDPIFVPSRTELTYAEMGDDEVSRFGLRLTTVFPQLREFLKTYD